VELCFAEHELRDEDRIRLCSASLQRAQRAASSADRTHSSGSRPVPMTPAAGRPAGVPCTPDPDQHLWPLAGNALGHCSDARALSLCARYQKGGSAVDHLCVVSLLLSGEWSSSGRTPSASAGTRAVCELVLRHADEHVRQGRVQLAAFLLCCAGHFRDAIQLVHAHASMSDMWLCIAPLLGHDVWLHCMTTRARSLLQGMCVCIYISISIYIYICVCVCGRCLCAQWCWLVYVCICVRVRSCTSPH
jgi:hypothetical protein